MPPFTKRVSVWMDVGFAWSIGAELNEAAKAFVEFLHLAMGAGQQ